MVQPINDTGLPALIRWHESCLTTVPHLMDPATTQLVTQTIMALEHLQTLRSEIAAGGWRPVKIETNL